MKRILPIAGLTLVLAAPAHAGSYHVYGCHGPEGQARTLRPFADFEWPANTMNHDDACRQDAGLASFEWPPATLVASGQRGGYRLDAPAGTVLTALGWRGSIGGIGPASGLRTEIARADDGAVLWDFSSDFGTDQRNFELPAGTSSIVLRQACRAILCATAGVPARTTISSLTVRLADTAPPTAGPLDGTLTAGGTHHGDAGVAFSAADAGAGLARALLEVDGVARVRQLDTSLDCTPLPGDPRGYGSAQPCARSAPVELTWPTASVRDGTHTVSAKLEDAAGNVSTVFGPVTVTTDNEPPRPGTVTLTRAGATLTAAPAGFAGQDVTYAYRWQRCDPVCEDVAGAGHARYTPGPGDTVRAIVAATDLGGTTTVPSATITTAPAPAATPTPAPTIVAAPAPAAPLAAPPAPSPAPSPAPACPPARGEVAYSASARPAAPACVRVSLSRRTIKLRYGRRVEIRGRVTTPAGAPLAGATLDVSARVRRPGAATRRVGGVGSARDGRFTYVAPAGPSRDLTIGGRTVSLLVSATGTFNVTRHGVRVRFSGRIRGGNVPRGGVLVEIRGSKGAVALTRTDGHGLYRVTTKATRQSFRARARKDSSWPFAGAPVGSPVSA